MGSHETILRRPLRDGQVSVASHLCALAAVSSPCPSKPATYSQVAGRMLSFVVPTFNEPEDSLRSSLRALVETQLPHVRFEVLVVDDSAPDHEPRVQAAVNDIAARLGRDGSMRMLRGPRRGKGAAIRAGALESTGEIVFLLDADIPVPLHHVPQFAALLAD